MDYFKKLPEEISLEILTRLPTESVLDSKLVCRNWRRIISHHPLFSRKQLHHLNRPSAESGKLGFLVATHERLHYVEYDDQLTKPIQGIKRINLTSRFRYFRLIGSCNGLICLLPQPQRHPSVCICNPITREFVILPEIRIDFDTDGYDYGETCFAYVSSTNEYKIVGFCKSGKTCFEVHVYTLGSGNGWRNLGNFNFGSESLQHRVVFVNGALYWLDHGLKMIGTFDLAEEKFGEYLSPPHFPSDSGSFFSIRVFDGFLLFAVEKFGEHGSFHDIWMLKNKNHDKEEGEEHQSLGWRKDFRIDENAIFLAVTKSDGVFNCLPYGLCIYYTKTSTWKILVKFHSPICQASPHKNTFVSLKELGEEAVEVMEQPHEDADPEYIYI